MKLLRICRFFLAVMIGLGVAAGGMAAVRGDGAQPVLVTCDLSETYQRIDGFGAFGLRDVNWADSTYGYREIWGEKVLADLGLTITRNEWYPESRRERQDSGWAQQKPNVAAFYQKAGTLGVPLKQIVAVWSPPGEWKSNQSTKGGGHLLPEHYGDFAQWLVQCIQAYQEAGIDVYGISPQNEPTLKTYYNSCVYTPAEYVAMIKAVGPVLRRRFPDVKIMGPDTASLDQTCTHFDESIEKALLDDPEACRYIDIWVIHGYLWKPFPKPLQAAAYWETLRNRLKSSGKPIWMTELSYFTDEVALAESAYAALKFGDVSGWVWWQLGENPANAVDHIQGQYALMQWDRPTERYYAAKQFFRYIRPGAVRVRCDAADPAVLAVAFKHDAEGTMTAVLINPTNRTRTVTLAGGPSVPMEVVRTSSRERCVSVGRLNRGEALDLPARSITTLYGGI